MKAPFSVVILTLNEERDLPRCLGSVRGCDDVVVLDSGSTDRTAEIARAAGARVFVRPFDTFAGQRNHAHEAIPFAHPWLFHLDADEQMTPELEAECAERAAGAEQPTGAEQAAGADGAVDGFMVAPKMIFMGRWIPHCTDFPAWQARFVNVARFRFIEVGHGQRESASMRMGRLAANYLHDLSSGGEEEWLEKHRRYARAEAAAHAASGATAPAIAIGLRELLAPERIRRRRALKRLSYGLPMRPALRFAYQYFLRRGFLDGRPGLRYCTLLARYEGFIAAELRRMKGSG